MPTRVSKPPTKRLTGRPDRPSRAGSNKFGAQSQELRRRPQGSSPTRKRAPVRRADAIGGRPESASPSTSGSQRAAGRAPRASFFAEFSLEKSFTLFGLVTSAFLIIAFGLDLAVGWPFERASVLFDVSCLIGGLSLAYLTGNVMRDQLHGRIR